MTPDGDRLCAVWTKVVRTETGASDYSIRGQKWVRLFNTVGSMLATQEIDLEHYVGVQVRWLIGRNQEGGMWPSILAGERAMERYANEPSADQVLVGVKEYYQAQAETFTRVCETMGEEVAFHNRVTNHSPLFIAFMRFKTGRELPEELRMQARDEMAAEPATRLVFTEPEFLEALKTNV